MRILLIVLLLIISNVGFGQTTTDREITLFPIKISEDTPKSTSSAFCIPASKFLRRNEVFLYFNLDETETIAIYLEGKLIKKRRISVDSLKTGDSPDFFTTINLSSCHQLRPRVRILFEGARSEFNFFIDEKYRVYSITSDLDNISIIKRNYRCF